MNSELAPLLACPACRHGLAATPGPLLCKLRSGVSDFARGAGFFARRGGGWPLSHRGIPATRWAARTSEEILARGDQRVLHLGAGSTEKKYPGCIELEHKIFRHTDVVGDAHALPFRDSSFDWVFAFNVFEHLRDPARAAQKSFVSSSRVVRSLCTRHFSSRCMRHRDISSTPLSSASGNGSAILRSSSAP